MKPKLVFGKKLTSQLVDKILSPYMTGAALMFTLGGEKVEVANLSLKEASLQSGTCIAVLTNNFQ